MVIRSKIYTIGGLSAHAEQGELLGMAWHFRYKPKGFIVHGEENVSLEFEKIVHSKLGLSAYVPHLGEELEI